MDINETIDFLNKHDEITEFYVLSKEIKLFLDIGHDSFYPEIKIKIYKSSVIESLPYHFDVSHHVHTPTQISPYYPSRTSAQTEDEAISQAISTTTSFLKSALAQGLEPDDTWLVPNKRF
ncbi:hypothetical protein [Raoultella ornithinolytica]|uniref:hypothetical protein n=1 Tax=Raoultella ornithinolytica TaxID=54291 RepID=UPI000E569204|nr:hypothetical protein [Raoultella ornithinolytica]KAB8156975.1 hypothetical protein FNV36_18600 [Raoultella ornithinolytica]KAB8166182.1 hypothetical protein FNV35_18455 [Raoultella ornithinolytica]QWU10961.1 hypothetical protein KP007_03590 [Raoultella ornithinolytica]HCI9483990.1 hypothetical protein [Raoultella ornithinolytica]